MPELSFTENRLSKVRTSILGVATVAIIGTGVYFWKYQEWIAIPRAREPWISHLRDPANAEFRNEQIMQTGALCGEVNAKNGIGGYVGFKKYISNGATSNYIEDGGVIGEWQHVDFMAKMQKEIDLLKMYQEWKNQGLPIPSHSDSEMHARAAKSFFLDKWNELCEPGHPRR
jgi:hypothetical protein